MKTQTRQQSITLEEFINQSKRISVMKASAAASMSASIVSMFWLFDLLPLQAIFAAAVLVYGIVSFCGSYYLEVQVNSWIDKLSVIVRESNLDIVTQVSSFETNSTEPEKLNHLVRMRDGHYKMIRLTTDQLKEVSSASADGGVLKRAHLTAENWPNLSRRWKDGAIQSELMNQGVIDENLKVIIFKENHNKTVSGAVPPLVGPPKDDVTEWGGGVRQ